MGRVIYVGWVTGGKVWGVYGENVRGIVTKVNRESGTTTSHDERAVERSRTKWTLVEDGDS